MTSAINPNVPVKPVGYSADMRANFAAAKSEIEALQTAAPVGGPFLPLAGNATVTGPTTWTAPLSYTATGGTTLRSAQDHAAGRNRHDLGRQHDLHRSWSGIPARRVAQRRQRRIVRQRASLQRLRLELKSPR